MQNVSVPMKNENHNIDSINNLGINNDNNNEEKVKIVLYEKIYEKS